MLSIALPKGSLEEQTLLLFEQADMTVRRSSRDYNATIDDPRIDRVKILRPQEIPKYVQEGNFDIGISGHDWVRESGADVVEVAAMPYAKTGTGTLKMVLAVNVTTAYFEEMGVDVEVHFSHGATEAKVPELVDAVVDLTETGSTLRRNGLKIIATVLESSTRLLANKDSWEDPAKREAIEEVRTLLLGVVEARGRVLLLMNVPESRLDELIDVLPAMKHPTVNRLHGSDYLEVTTVAEKATVNELLPKLKAAGAEDILEMPISKIVR